MHETVTTGLANATVTRAARAQWAGLAVIALPCMLYAMDLTVLNLALPAIGADLKPSASQLLWIIDIYGFMVAGFLITMGNLGDRIGRRRLLLIGAAAFGVASLLAAFATSAAMLIVLRALLGVAGATLAPSTLSLIRNMFHDPQERTFAIGVWIASYSVGAAIGPVLGGGLLVHFHWGSVFLINVPVMALLLVLGRWLLPEFRDPEARRIDPPSVALSIGSVLLAVYGCKQLAENGAGWLPAGCLLAGLAVGLAFLRRQRLLADPLVELRLFRERAFGIAILTYTLGCFTMFGNYLLVAQHLQLVLGLSPLQAGLWTVPGALAFVAGSMATPALVQRVGPRAAIAGGLCVAAAGCTLLAWAARGTAAQGIAAAQALQSLGLAPVFALATDLVVGAAPPGRAGAAAAISETSSELGGALGIALFGSLGAALYRATMADFAPAGVEAPWLDAARSTLAAALQAARQIEPPLGAALLGTARAASTEGLQWAAAIGAAALLGAALLAARALKTPATEGRGVAAASQGATKR